MKHVVYVLIYIPAFVKQRVEKKKKKLIRVLKLIYIYLNLVLVQGRDASILLGLLKEFIPLNSLFLRVYSKVFNLSLPLSFLSFKSLVVLL